MCPVHAAEASPLPSLRPAPAPAHLLLLLVPAAVPGAVPVTGHGAVARAAAPPVAAPAAAAAAGAASPSSAVPATVAGAGPAAAAAASAAALAAVAHLDLDPAAAHPRAVQPPHRVLRVPGVLHLHKREARGFPRHPDVAYGPVLGERVLEVIPEVKSILE